jgi:thiol-disulfide isomerase/thioredoxin
MGTKAHGGRSKRDSSSHRPRGWLALGGAVVVVALIWVATPHGGHAAPLAATGRVGTAVGDRAPVMQVSDIGGRTLAFAGKPTVLYFMASWCSSCAYGESQLRQVQFRFGKRVNLVSIDVDPANDTVAALEAFRQQYGGAWPHVLDRGQRLVAAFGIHSLDTMVILDGRGVIVYDGGTQPASVVDRTLQGQLGA